METKKCKNCSCNFISTKYNSVRVFCCRKCNAQFHSIQDNIKNKGTDYRSNTLRKLRIKALEMLGGKCKNCLNDDFDVLHIDHIIPLSILKNKREEKHM